MTCKECMKFKECRDRLGTTPFYDNAFPSEKVEEQCGKFEKTPPIPNKHRWVKTI